MNSHIQKLSENLNMLESMMEEVWSSTESFDLTETGQVEKQRVFLPHDVVSFVDEDGTTIRGVVKNTDYLGDDLGLSFKEKIAKLKHKYVDNNAETFAISTYPSKKVVQKQSEELKLLHRPFILGEIVRRGKSDEIGTVVAIEFEGDVKVPGTNLELEKISSKRLFSCAPTFPGQKVALNGWIGEITKYKSKTRSMAETGSFSSSDEVEVNWVACGKNEPSPKPSRKVDSSELSQIQAPWNQENIAYKNSGTASKYWGVRLNDRFRIKLANEEAQRLNILMKNQEVNPLKVVDFAKPNYSKEAKKISSDDFLGKLTKIANDDENQNWVCLRFPNFTVITYKGNSSTWYNDLDPEDPDPKKISSLFEAIFKNEKVDKEGMKEKVNRAYEEIKKLLGEKLSLDSMNIQFNEFTWPMPEGKTRKNYEFDLGYQSGVEDSANFEFKDEKWIAVEITSCTSTCKVRWQSGEIEDCNSTELSKYPSLLISQKFLPGNYVVRKKQENLAEWGSIFSVDFTKKQMVVQWYIDETTKERETVSFNDATPHPDLKFPLGSLVVNKSQSQINCPGVGMVKGFLPCGKLEIMWADRT